MIDSTTCSLCGSHSTRELYPKHGIVECVECGLARAADFPTAERMRSLYSESYFCSSDSGALGYDNYTADRAKITRTFHKRMAEIEKWTGHKGRLLDVGCATGFSLVVVKERGWEAEGVEISKYACDFGRENLGLDIHCGSLEDTDLAPKTFDAITMWDYIEHNPDPRRELALANRALKLGGLLALTTPNIASLPARISGSRWMGIKHEEHLYYFSIDVANKLLRSCGFEPVLARHVGKYIDFNFFVRRAALYSKQVSGVLDKLIHLLGLGESVIYINPFDIMLIYGKKTGDPT